MSDWNLQTNIKNKPNAQGTLFSGGKSQMNPAKRYPRGYTPDRQKAVLSALRGWGVADYVTSESDLPEDDMGLGPHALRVTEQIKQSSIPPEHLHHLSIKVADRFEDGPIEHHLDDEVAGHYKATPYKSGGERIVHGEAVVAHDTSPYTVLHEIGHHVSATANNRHASYDSPHQRGREEGFADAYADKHMTPVLNNGSRHNWVRGRENYPPDEWQATPGREHEFHSGYDNMRPYDGRLPSKHDHADQRWLASKKHEERNPMLPGMKDVK